MQLIQEAGMSVQGLMSVQVLLRGCRLAALLIIFSMLASCQYSVPGIAGLPADHWQYLPVRAWLLNDGIKPEALALCASADCPSRMMVAVLTVEADKAGAYEAMLHDPQALKTFLEQAHPRKSSASTLAVQSLPQGAMTGLALTILSPSTGRVAHAALLGGRTRDKNLRLILVTGKSLTDVTHTASLVAVTH